MSAKLLKTLTAAHLNGINSTLGAIETQVAALKTTLKELGVEAKPSKKKPAKVEDEEEEETDEDEEEETDEDESDDEESDDEDEEEETDEDESDDEESDDEDEEEETKAPKLTKKIILAALKAYAAKHKKTAAMAKLKKATGADSVHDVDPKKYAAAYKALKLK